MLYYEIESGNALGALSLMDEQFKNENPVLYARALQSFNVNSEALTLLDKIENTKPALSERDYFHIGALEYKFDRCIPALKALKKAKNKLSQEEKQEQAYYRSNCFIKLGSSPRAAQILSKLLNGLWISHAYYNLAMDYAANNKKTKALVSLKVAESLNAGQLDTEKELNDRINVTAGHLYLNDGQYDKAINVLNRVYIDSSVSAQALYLKGVAQLENGNFRAATQSWSGVRKNHLIEPGVKESLLAIPFAYERAGYTSQALESYSNARTLFTDELTTIEKIESLIKKRGVIPTFLEGGQLEGLEWFLTDNSAKNTVRGAYYNFFMGDNEIYRHVELLAELEVLSASMGYWSSQLAVFNKALKSKQRSFIKKSKSFKQKVVETKIADFEKRLQQLSKSTTSVTSNAQGSEEVIQQRMLSLKDRLKSVSNSIRQGKSKISIQLGDNKSLQKQVGRSKKKLKQVMALVEKDAAKLILEKIKALKIELVFSQERADQGLTHVLETIAELDSRKRKKRTLKDGRYQ